MGGGKGRWGIRVRIHKASGVWAAQEPPPHPLFPSSPPGPRLRPEEQTAHWEENGDAVRSPTSEVPAPHRSLDTSLPSLPIPGLTAPAHLKLCPAGRELPSYSGIAKPSESRQDLSAGQVPKQQGPMWVPGPSWRHQPPSRRGDYPASSVLGAGTVGSCVPAMNGPRGHPDNQPLSGRTRC